jgi:class III poly(R)-hydroxyalkanoic acid synthase PhaE subunit
MANDPFRAYAAAASGNPADWQRNLDLLSRQYWGAWGEALRAAGGQPAPSTPGWQDAVEWWSRLAHGGRSEANDLAERFNMQARHWFGQMQQVAAQFAGQDHGPAQIADAWKKALGAAGENPFPEIFRAMRGHGLQGLEQWIEDASPYLDAWRREGMSWLSMPAFGIGREHQERLQGLARAQVEYQERSSAYNALMAKAGQRAFELFEQKLAGRNEPGNRLASARALFDLWIDAAEEAYAEIALSQEFREIYGALVNAQMRLRNGLQKEVELACGLLGIPTRSEIDATHRKVAELERQVRRLRDAAAAGANAGAAPAAKATASGRKPTPARTAAKPAQSAPPPESAAAPEHKRAAPTPKERARVKSEKSDKPKTRTARAANRPARKSAPASLLAGIAIPMAPADFGRGRSGSPKPTGRSKSR